MNIQDLVNSINGTLVGNDEFFSIDGFTGKFTFLNDAHTGDIVIRHWINDIGIQMAFNKNIACLITQTPKDGAIEMAEKLNFPLIITDKIELANAYAGICYAQLGQYGNAVKYLNKFSADDHLVSPAILGTMGNCYAQLGELDKAAATLVKAADKANSHALSPIYLIQAGQIYEKLGKNSEAVNAYKAIKDKYFNSYQAMDIDKYIERASMK